VNHSLIHVVILGILLLHSLIAPLGALETQTFAARSLDIGDILGAGYDDISNELVVYASEARRGNTSQLHADDVVKMGLAALTVGNFAFSLERANKHMAIWYLPVAARGRLTAIFDRSTVEETFYRTDRLLKDLANGAMPDDSLRLGASALFLCSKQLCGASQVTADDFSATYVTFFELATGYVSDGLRVWFDEPALIVKAASRNEGEEAPDCIKEFAASLTKNMDQLMNHRTLGKEFRRLRNLLLLSKVFGWASSLYIPIRSKQLEQQQTRRVQASRPFRHRDHHIVCPDLEDPTRVRDMVLRGGVNVTPASETPERISPIMHLSVGLAPDHTEHGKRARAEQLVRPMLGARTVTINGRQMLAVSTNQIVGLTLRREAR
jgi:hypothetical protein